ncbi:MAG: biotin--[acetyl-CoA-carboxylase] ligase [Acetatifactor sp.]|nr:biotin--[acetyl-CoA-carboxylase] ligase [Acetatifactor sp.]
MKAEILALLRESGDYISGQELCTRFGVTRSAVWKAVGQLKREGYEIEAVQNRGYKLVAAEVYGENELRSRIHTAWAGAELHFQQITGSTNLLAKQAGEEGASHGALFVADEQTAGRGRRGRNWQSPPGANIYFTILLRPDFQPNQASMLTLVMAHSVAVAVRRVTGLEPGIKWPNDVLLEGRKICGILTEMSLEREYIHYVVCGVGINVAGQEFPEEIREHATTVEAVCGRHISKGELLQYVMEAFEQDYDAFAAAGDLTPLLESYNRMLVNCDRSVRVLDPKGEWEGIARGINSRGELLVENAEGIVTAVYAGEVSVRGIYGYV